MIRYRVRLASLNRHHFEVNCRVGNPSPEQRFTLPSWTPGSYLLREYAKHVVGIRAESVGGSVALEKVSKSTWSCHNAGVKLTVTRELWQRYGRADEGMPEAAFEKLAEEVSGLDLSDFFAAAVRGTEDLPLARFEAGQTVRITGFRDEELLEFPVTLAGAALDSCALSLVDKPGPDALSRRQAWLGA